MEPHLEACLVTLGFPPASTNFFVTGFLSCWPSWLLLTFLMSPRTPLLLVFMVLATTLALAGWGSLEVCWRVEAMATAGWLAV